ncbi:MAG TPA: EAL domain-containing protein, partial [Acidimicrobiales bacterium]|nr:EAL domain-containing protein [Acidimicrobiales bacterium]
MRRGVVGVVGGYALIGAAWIVVTSSLVARGDGDGALAEIVKGLAFVAVTSAVLTVLLLRRERQLDRTADRFRQLIESSGEVTYRFRVGDDPRFDYVSENVVDLIGYTAEQHLQRPDITARTVHPEDRAIAAALAAGTDRRGRAQLRMVTPEGRIVHTEHVDRPITDHRGRLVAVEARMRDITTERRDAAEIALGAEIDEWLLANLAPLEILERACLRLLDGLDVDMAWIGLRRPDGRVEVVASAGDGNYLDGIDVRWDDGPLADGPTGHAIRDGAPTLARPGDTSFEPWRRRALQSGFTAALAVPIRRGTEVVAALTTYSRFGLPFEPAAVRRLERIAHRLALVLTRVDDMSGLPRRTSYPAAVDRVCANDVEGTADITVVVVGRLTALRRSAGFDVGEAALATAGQRIARAVPPGSEVVRTGDDEITVISPPSDTVVDLGRSLLDHLRHPTVAGDGELVLPAAAGCVRFHVGDDHDLSLRRATAAAARAYEEHPFSCVVASDELESAERDRSTAHRLRKGIHDGAIEVWWQPQVDARSGRMVAAEALVRWRRDDGSISTPVEFLALAEEDGSIVDIGRIVLAEAIAHGARWRARGLERVCVNASVRELAEPGFVDHLRGLLVQNGVRPEMLEIELVETTLLGRRVADVLDELHRLGVRVAVDDYGTGWSSLSYLAQFRFDTLKIDRFFVRDIGVDDRARALVDSTVALGASLDIVVVAEGVEEVAHADHLRSVGCDLLQGYAISRPEPADELEQILDG